ncbi:protein CrcB-like protein [Oscillospiraceae bacterium 38-13]
MKNFFVLLMPVVLMIAAIVFALFSDKIDMAVKGNKQVKKVIIIFSVGVFLICTIAIISVLL